MYLAYCLGNAYQIQSFLLPLNLRAYLAYRLDHALYSSFHYPPLAQPLADQMTSS